MSISHTASLPPSDKTERAIAPEEVTGVCDDGDSTLVHILDELEAGLGTLGELANRTQWEGESPHVLLFAMQRKADAARRIATSERARARDVSTARDLCDAIADGEIGRCFERGALVALRDELDILHLAISNDEMPLSRKAIALHVWRLSERARVAAKVA